VIAWHWSESWNLTKDRDTRRYETAPDHYHLDPFGPNLYLFCICWICRGLGCRNLSALAALQRQSSRPPQDSSYWSSTRMVVPARSCQNFVDVCSMFCQATILIFIIIYISLSVLSSLLALRSKSDLQCFFNKFKLRSVLFWNKMKQRFAGVG